MGRITCTRFTEILKERGDAYLVAGGWVSGYVSGVNALQAQTYDILPWQSTELVLQLLGRACEANPDARLANLMNQYLRQIADDRLAERSDRVELKRGSDRVFLYRETLARVQTKLRQAGFEPGVVNGAPDPRTSEALRAFQAENDLTETGLPDQRTLLRLRLGRE